MNFTTTKYQKYLIPNSRTSKKKNSIDYMIKLNK